MFDDWGNALTTIVVIYLIIAVIVMVIAFILYRLQRFSNAWGHPSISADALDALFVGGLWLATGLSALIERWDRR